MLTGKINQKFLLQICYKEEKSLVESIGRYFIEMLGELPSKYELFLIAADGWKPFCFS
jgi:hypothetical protein